MADRSAACATNGVSMDSIVLEQWEILAEILGDDSLKNYVKQTTMEKKVADCHMDVIRELNIGSPVAIEQKELDNVIAQLKTNLGDTETTKHNDMFSSIVSQLGLGVSTMPSNELIVQTLNELKRCVGIDVDNDEESNKRIIAELGLGVPKTPDSKTYDNVLKRLNEAVAGNELPAGNDSVSSDSETESVS